MENNILNDLQKWAVIIIGLAVIVGIGMVILIAFGNTNASCASGITDVVISNETPAWMNNTGYTLQRAGDNGFISLNITSVLNYTTYINSSIVLANVTVNTTSGVITNATKDSWNNVSVSYTFTWNDVHTFNKTSQTCQNSTGANDWTGQGTIFTNMVGIVGYLGSGSGSLVSWIPVIIVLLIGMFFLGYFLTRKKNKY